MAFFGAGTCNATSRRLLYDGFVDAERYWSPLRSERLAFTVQVIAARQQLASAFAHGVSFYFVGDSITGQHFRSLACTVGINNAASHAALSKWTCFGRDSLPSRMCYTPGGYWGDPTVTHAPGLIELAASGFLQTGNVLLLNEGAHFRWHDHKSHTNENHRYNPPELERLQESHLASPHITVAVQAGVRVVWRETLAQHWNTTDGLYEHFEQTKEMLACVPFSRAAFRHLEKHNAQINDLVRASIPEVRFLEAFALTATSASMASAHFMDCSAQAKGKPANSSAWTEEERARICNPVASMDCTHYCEQSEAFQMINVALAKMLNQTSETAENGRAALPPVPERSPDKQPASSHVERHDSHCERHWGLDAHAAWLSSRVESCGASLWSRKVPWQDDNRKDELLGSMLINLPLACSTLPNVSGPVPWTSVWDNPTPLDLASDVALRASRPCHAGASRTRTLLIVASGDAIIANPWHRMVHLHAAWLGLHLASKGQHRRGAHATSHDRPLGESGQMDMLLGKPTACCGYPAWHNWSHYVATMRGGLFSTREQEIARSSSGWRDIGWDAFGLSSASRLYFLPEQVPWCEVSRVIIASSGQMLWELAWDRHFDCGGGEHGFMWRSFLIAMRAGWRIPPPQLPQSADAPVHACIAKGSYPEVERKFADDGRSLGSIFNSSCFASGTPKIISHLFGFSASVPYREQVAYVQTCDIFAGLHGGAFPLASFMHPPAAVYGPATPRTHRPGLCLYVADRNHLLLSVHQD